MISFYKSCIDLLRAQLIADNVMKNLPRGRNGWQDEVHKQMERFLKPGQ